MLYHKHPSTRPVIDNVDTDGKVCNGLGRPGKAIGNGVVHNAIYQNRRSGALSDTPVILLF